MKSRIISSTFRFESSHAARVLASMLATRSVGHEISVQLVEELLDALFGHAVMQPHVRRMNDARCSLGRPPFELCASFARKAIKDAFDVFLLSGKSEYVFAVGEMHGGWGGSDKTSGAPLRVKKERPVLRLVRRWRRSGSAPPNTGSRFCGG